VYIVRPRAPYLLTGRLDTSYFLSNLDNNDRRKVLKIGAEQWDATQGTIGGSKEGDAKAWAKDGGARLCASREKNVTNLRR
jgi:hypothetical protein